MASRTHSDLVIVGGGPAGCAAGVMAASLGMTTVLVEPHSLCHKLENASSLVNVLGGFTTGADLAATIRSDVARAQGCRVLLGRRVDHVHAADDEVEIRLDNGETLVSAFTVVATGVEPLRLADVDWITTDIDEPPPVWQATETDLTGHDVIVVGIDRPVGTLLRSMPDVDTRLIVAYHPSEQYKAGEISHDPRVSLHPTSQATLRAAADGRVSLRTRSGGGDQPRTAARLFGNLGSRPVAPGGDVTTGPDGYCPPGQQHPRVLIAGDLRSARHQRIMTAFGSGAEAALTAYYHLADVPGR